MEDASSSEFNENSQLTLIRGASLSNTIALGRNKGHRVKRVNPFLNPTLLYATWIHRKAYRHYTPPRSNLTIYHGVYAPRFKYRNKIVKNNITKEKTGNSKVYRLSWAELLKRVFNIDSLKCSRCKQQMAFVTTICKREIIDKLLASIGIKKIKIKIPEYRGPPNLFDEFDQDIPQNISGFF